MIFSRSLRASPVAFALFDARDDDARADVLRDADPLLPADDFTAVPRPAPDLAALPLREDAAPFEAAPFDAALFEAAPLRALPEPFAAFDAAEPRDDDELPPRAGGTVLPAPREEDDDAAASLLWPLLFDEAEDFLPAADFDSGPLRPFDVAIVNDWEFMIG